MMGIFAFYNGWIYNEFFAIPLDIFGSCYEEEPKILYKEPSVVVGYKRVTDMDYCVYTVGFDPRWPQTNQLLTYTNNFKMKISVIFAILQMALGILMRGLNNLYFK